MKEHFKSLLLIVLMISTIYLTKVMFANEKIVVEELKIEYEKVDFLKIVKPQNYFFNFGDSFIKYFDEYDISINDKFYHVNIKDEYETSIKNFIYNSEVINLEVISKEKWSLIFRGKSVLAEYSFPIKIKNLFEVYGFNTTLRGGSNVNVTSILLPANDSSTIYIHDGVEEIYYKIVSNESEVWITDIYRILKENNVPNYYKEIGEKYGLSDLVSELSLDYIDNIKTKLLLIPSELSREHEKVTITSEINLNGVYPKKEIEEHVRKVFDNDMSFVKKSVYDDMSTAFLYGYGEKIYKVNVDGSFDYTAKQGDYIDQPINFLDGITQSMHQIKKMSLLNDLYLADYKVNLIAEGYETIYYFNLELEGSPYYLPSVESGYLVEIRFINGYLVKAKIFSKIKYPVPKKNYEITNVKFNFNELLTQNIDIFVEGYLIDRSDLDIEKKDVWKLCLYEMNEISLNYYVLTTSGKKEELIPVWNILIANTRYFVDLSNNEIISSEKENKE